MPPVDLEHFGGIALLFARGSARARARHRQLAPRKQSTLRSMVELVRQVIPVQAKTSKLVAKVLNSPHGKVRRAALAALCSAPGTLTQQQHAQLTPFLINAVVHDGHGLFLPQVLHYSFLSNPALVAKMREAREATLAKEHAAELLLYLEPATLDTCHAHQLVGCLKSPGAPLCSRALAARVLCALDGEQLVPHVADLVASAMLSSHPAQCAATPLINIRLIRHYGPLLPLEVSLPLVHLRWASLEALGRIEPRSALNPHGALLVDRLVQLLAEPGQQQRAALRQGSTEVALLFSVAGRLESIPIAHVAPLRLWLVRAACACGAGGAGGAASATPAWPFQRMQLSLQPDPSIVRRVLALLRRNRPLLNEWVESIVALLACHVTSAVRIAAIETLKMADGQPASCRI